ncbi:MAG: nitrite reductase, partial [Sphingobacteriia bacterium]
MSRNNPYDLSALDPLVQQDIHELENKLAAFQNGSLPDENFRAYRLTRGIYGQRQEGVQMIRVKLPFGHLKPDQLDRIAHVAETYGHGVLHATTRQDI